LTVVSKKLLGPSKNMKKKENRTDLKLRKKKKGEKQSEGVDLGTIKESRKQGDKRGGGGWGGGMGEYKSCYWSLEKEKIKREGHASRASRLENRANKGGKKKTGGLKKKK